MKLIPLVATSLNIDLKKNNISYGTDTTAPRGVLLMADADGSHDMVLTNQLHEGGNVTVILKPTRAPSKRYEIGERVAYLLVLE